MEMRLKTTKLQPRKLIKWQSITSQIWPVVVKQYITVY